MPYVLSFYCSKKQNRKWKQLWNFLPNWPRGKNRPRMVQGSSCFETKSALKKLFPLSHLHAFTGLCQEDVQRVAKENNDGVDHVQLYISDMSRSPPLNKKQTVLQHRILLCGSGLYAFLVWKCKESLHAQKQNNLNCSWSPVLSRT